MRLGRRDRLTRCAAITAAPLTVRDGWLAGGRPQARTRVASGMLSRDTFVDIAGYAGLAGEERGERNSSESSIPGSRKKPLYLQGFFLVNKS